MKTALEALQKEVRQLKSQLGLDTSSNITTLTMNHGEDERSYLKAWRASNPEAPEPELVLVTTIIGAVPRLEFASEPSVRAALPVAKAFLMQLQDAEAEAGWRAIAAKAGIDYDAIEAVRPASGTVQ